MSIIQGRAAELWVASGTGTSMTKEAMEVVSGTRYHVTAAAKRYIDPTSTILIYCGAGETLTSSGWHLEGGCHVVFDSAPSTPVKISAKYLTPAEVAYVQGWTLNLVSAIYEVTSLGDTAKQFQGSGLLEWSGSFERFYDANVGGGTVPVWEAFAVANGTNIIGRFFTDQPNGLVWTGWISPDSWDVTMPVELAKENFSFKGVGVCVYTTDET